MYIIYMETFHPTTGSLVWHLALKWRAQVDRAVAGFGMTHAQYSVLASLYAMSRKGKTPTQRDLAEYTGLQAIFVSKLVKALEAEGLMKRRVDDRDSRANRLGLTDKGQQAIVRAMEVVRELDRKLNEPLGGRDSVRSRAFAETLTILLNQKTQHGQKR